MDKNEAVKFFDFTPGNLEEMKKFILSQNERKMVKIFDKFIHSTTSNSFEAAY